jgi:hypothetical protein
LLFADAADGTAKLDRIIEGLFLSPERLHDYALEGALAIAGNSRRRRCVFVHIAKFANWIMATLLSQKSLIYRRCTYYATLGTRGLLRYCDKGTVPLSDDKIFLSLQKTAGFSPFQEFFLEPDMWRLVNDKVRVDWHASGPDVKCRMRR